MGEGRTRTAVTPSNTSGVPKGWSRAGSCFPAEPAGGESVSRPCHAPGSPGSSPALVTPPSRSSAAARCFLLPWRCFVTTAVTLLGGSIVPAALGAEGTQRGPRGSFPRALFSSRSGDVPFASDSATSCLRCSPQPL